MKKLVLKRDKEVTNVDPDAVEIGALYARSRNSQIDSVRNAWECGRRLMAKKESLSHGEWLPWLQANERVLGFETRRTASRLMKLASNGTLTSHLEAPEAVALSRKIWGNSDNHRAMGTGENEWYTPSEYIELAREVMGGIDLDPATSKGANKRIRAESIFTKEENGLTHPWYGRVWLNPPFAQPLIMDFAKKLVDEIAALNVSQAIALTHNYTDTAWFHLLAKNCRAICFTRGRIGFVNERDVVAAPTQGQAFFYFADDVARFAEVFRETGFIVQPR